MVKTLTNKSNNVIFGKHTSFSNSNVPVSKQHKNNSKPNSIMDKSIQNPAVREGEKLIREYRKNPDKTWYKIAQGQVGQWCADAVNYIYTKALGKNPFGVTSIGTYDYNEVFGLMMWGKDHNRYHQIIDPDETSKMMNKMKPGDVIIFKSLHEIRVERGKTVLRHASHTGIVKEVKNGIVYTIEGNANVYKRNKYGERLFVHNNKEGENGNQAIGDFQETFKRDGMLEKVYNVNGLKDNGYSGYIDMQNLNNK